MFVEKSGILNVRFISLTQQKHKSVDWKMYFYQTCCYYNCFLMSDNYLPNIDQYKLKTNKNIILRILLTGTRLRESEKGHFPDQT